MLALESQRSDKNKEGLGYSAVPPPPAQVYFPPKMDMSWSGLPEFADDTITDYSRPSPAIESNPDDLQNRNPSVTKTGASSTPQQESTTASASEGTSKKKGRTITFTIEDMQMGRNDVKRNRSDLDTMSLDDLFNHLKVYEPEVQKKSESKSHNMAFISSAKNSSGNEEVNTASIPTASTQVFPTGPNVATASISLDTACAYIAS
nr:hypothetical protein [Tanacetum cinerariifolium]